MQFLVDLWLPVLVSAFVVFVMSALVWMVFPHHRNDWGKLPNEDVVRDALRDAKVAPGQYVTPHMGGMKEAGTPEGRAKLERGPIAFLTVVPGGVRPMGATMVQSFVGNLIVSAFVAYVAWHTLAPGTEYLQVFRVTGAIAFMAYALGSFQDSVWLGRPWSRLLLGAFDALFYSVLLAGVFGWRWQ